jgi:hypothetical protein
MEGQCHPFLSKMVPGRSYMAFVCLYPAQAQGCALGLGNGGLLQGVHATWEQGQ